MEKLFTLLTDSETPTQRHIHSDTPQPLSTKLCLADSDERSLYFLFPTFKLLIFEGLHIFTFTYFNAVTVVALLLVTDFVVIEKKITNAAQDLLSKCVYFQSECQKQLPF